MNESVDANVLLRFFLHDEEAQTRQVGVLFMRENVIYHVADIVFQEMADVLYKYYDYDNQEAARLLSVMLNMPQLRCNRDILEPTLTLFAAHPKLSFADCYLACYARAKDCEPLWTFDRKLAAQGGSVELVK
jgi:predicted nucleic-acid-binding protein